MRVRVRSLGKCVCGISRKMCVDDGESEVSKKMCVGKGEGAISRICVWVRVMVSSLGFVCG